MKVLIISYPFPPYGGMSQRSVYFANHLASAHHHVDVIAANPSPHFHGYDEGMTRLISDKVKVHRTFAGLFHHLRCRYKGAFAPADEGGVMRKALNALLSHVFIPASTIEWLPWGFAAGYRLCRKNGYDVIYSHGDPFIANVLAVFLKKIFKTPLVIYIGDPRFFGTYSRYRTALRYLEGFCLKGARRVIVNCASTLDGYLLHFPGVEKEIFSVITDGYDDERFDNLPGEASTKFRIVYTGVFYDNAREPFELFKALASFEYDDIELVIAGDASSRYKEYARRNGLDGKVVFLGHQPHSRVISLQKGASILLLIGWSGGYQVPGKLFEYFAARRPVLTIRYDSKDAASRFVTERSRGVVVENRAAEISAELKRLYRLWKEGRLDEGFDLDTVEEFAWKNLSKRLEEVFCSAAVKEAKA